MSVTSKHVAVASRKRTVALVLIAGSLPVLFVGTMLGAAGASGRTALFMVAFGTTVLLCGLELLRRTAGDV